MQSKPARPGSTWRDENYHWDPFTIEAYPGQPRLEDLKAALEYEEAGTSFAAATVGSAAQNSKPTCCQVEGCNRDLSMEKPYYRRNFICEEHTRSLVLLINGIEQRFCQQCGKFEPVTEFDGSKRSCRMQLAKHNKRRQDKMDAIRASCKRNSEPATGKVCKRADSDEGNASSNGDVSTINKGSLSEKVKKQSWGRRALSKALAAFKGPQNKPSKWTGGMPQRRKGSSRSSGSLDADPSRSTETPSAASGYIDNMKAARPEGLPHGLTTGMLPDLCSQEFALPHANSCELQLQSSDQFYSAGHSGLQKSFSLPVTNNARQLHSLSLLPLPQRLPATSHKDMDAQAMPTGLLQVNYLADKLAFQATNHSKPPRASTRPSRSSADATIQGMLGVAANRSLDIHFQSQGYQQHQQHTEGLLAGPLEGTYGSQTLVHTRSNGSHQLSQILQAYASHSQRLSNSVSAYQNSSLQHAAPGEPANVDCLDQFTPDFMQLGQPSANNLQESGLLTRDYNRVEVLHNDTPLNTQLAFAAGREDTLLPDEQELRSMMSQQQAPVPPSHAHNLVAPHVTSMPDFGSVRSGCAQRELDMQPAAIQDQIAWQTAYAQRQAVLQALLQSQSSAMVLDGDMDHHSLQQTHKQVYPDHCSLYTDTVDLDVQALDIQQLHPAVMNRRAGLAHNSPGFCVANLGLHAHNQQIMRATSGLSGSSTAVPSQPGLLRSSSGTSGPGLPAMSTSICDQGMPGGSGPAWSSIVWRDSLNAGQQQQQQDQQRGSSTLLMTDIELAQSIAATGGNYSTYDATDILTQLSLKLHSCTPEDLPPHLYNNLSKWVSTTGSTLMQGHIRPGCTHLTLSLNHSPRGFEMLLQLLLSAEGSCQSAAIEGLQQMFGADWVKGRKVTLQQEDQVLVLEPGQPVQYLTASEAAGNRQFPASCVAYPLAVSTNAPAQLQATCPGSPRGAATDMQVHVTYQGRDCAVAPLSRTQTSSEQLACTVRLPALRAAGSMRAQVLCNGIMGPSSPVVVVDDNSVCDELNSLSLGQEADDELSMLLTDVGQLLDYHTAMKRFEPTQAGPSTQSQLPATRPSRLAHVQQRASLDSDFSAPHSYASTQTSMHPPSRPYSGASACLHGMLQTQTGRFMMASHWSTDSQASSASCLASTSRGSTTAADASVSCISTHGPPLFQADGEVTASGAPSVRSNDTAFDFVPARAVRQPSLRLPQSLVQQWPIIQTKGQCLLQYCCDRGLPYTAKYVYDIMKAQGMPVDIVAARAGEGLSLLHRAVRSGSMHMVRLVVQWAEERGCRPLLLECGPAGVTALHVAAVMQDGGSMAAWVVSHVEGAAQVWLTSRSSSGLTAADMAASTAASFATHIAYRQLPTTAAVHDNMDSTQTRTPDILLSSSITATPASVDAQVTTHTCVDTHFAACKGMIQITEVEDMQDFQLDSSRLSSDEVETDDQAPAAFAMCSGMSGSDASPGTLTCDLLSSNAWEQQTGMDNSSRSIGLSPQPTTSAAAPSTALKGSEVGGGGWSMQWPHVPAETAQDPSNMRYVRRNQLATAGGVSKPAAGPSCIPVSTGEGMRVPQLSTDGRSSSGSTSGNFVLTSSADGSSRQLHRVTQVAVPTAATDTTSASSCTADSHASACPTVQKLLDNQNQMHAAGSCGILLTPVISVHSSPANVMSGSLVMAASTTVARTDSFVAASDSAVTCPGLSLTGMVPCVPKSCDRQLPALGPADDSCESAAAVCGPACHPVLRLVADQGFAQQSRQRAAAAYTGSCDQRRAIAVLLAVLATVIAAFIHRCIYG